MYKLVSEGGPIKTSNSTLNIVRAVTVIKAIHDEPEKAQLFINYHNTLNIKNENPATFNMMYTVSPKSNCCSTKYHKTSYKTIQ